MRKIELQNRRDTEETGAQRQKRDRQREMEGDGGGAAAAAMEEGEEEESAAVAADPGFVLDAASGLYYHASSGFYYDAKAGWYYSTRDGLYYTFENDAYVPLASSSKTTMSAMKEEDNNNNTLLLREEQVVGDIIIHGAEIKSNQDGAHEGVAAAAKTEKETAARSFPDDLHSDSAAWVQHGETANPQSPCNEDNEDASELQGAVSSATQEEETRPASVWIQEALVELYLQNYPSSEAVGMSAAETFVESSSTLYDVYNVQNSGVEEGGGGTNIAYAHGIDNYAMSHFPDADFATRSCYEEATAMDAEAYVERYGTSANEFHESDDGSEELEEGEWRPEEGEREKYIFDDSDEEAEEGEICDSDEPSHWDQQQGFFSSRENGAQEQSGSGTGLSILDQEYREYEYGSSNMTASGNGQVQSYADLMEAPNEATDGQRDASEAGISVEEQWHAQYGRVPRSGVRVRLYPGSIELWDWTTVEQEQEQKTAKKKKLKRLSVRLVGRLAPNSNNLHPSLGGSGGFIRTSLISEVDHEFVKVSSGRIYKLRRPSSKHVATVTAYDSSNPTRDWGCPQINTAGTTDGETDAMEAEDQNASTSADTTKSSGETVVSKPFVPNFGHWKFQPLVPTKRNRGPSANPSFLALTKDEMEEIEQRKQRYRDRAAERRSLHRGFGTGPGQKGMSVHEMEKLEAETATEMPTVLAKAAKAQPLGSNNVGKRMLQGMGWKEGQSLGPGEGGLINPIQALGNTGRSGLGWN